MVSRGRSQWKCIGLKWNRGVGGLLCQWSKIAHHFDEEQDPDLQQSNKSDPDPRRNEQADQDLHQSKADPQPQH
jgi:hypothetical protein